jgi:hypothetical protein
VFSTVVENSRFLKTCFCTVGLFWQFRRVFDGRGKQSVFENAISESFRRSWKTAGLFLILFLIHLFSRLQTCFPPENGLTSSLDFAYYTDFCFRWPAICLEKIFATAWGPLEKIKRHKSADVSYAKLAKFSYSCLSNWTMLHLYLAFGSFVNFKRMAGEAKALYAFMQTGYRDVEDKYKHLVKDGRVVRFLESREARKIYTTNVPMAVALFTRLQKRGILTVLKDTFLPGTVGRQGVTDKSLKDRIDHWLDTGIPLNGKKEGGPDMGSLGPFMRVKNGSGLTYSLLEMIVVSCSGSLCFDNFFNACELRNRDRIKVVDGEAHEDDNTWNPDLDAFKQMWEKDSDIIVKEWQHLEKLSTPLEDSLHKALLRTGDPVEIDVEKSKEKCDLETLLKTTPPPSAWPSKDEMKVLKKASKLGKDEPTSVKATRRWLKEAASSHLARAGWLLALTEDWDTKQKAVTNVLKLEKQYPKGGKKVPKGGWDVENPTFQKLSDEYILPHMRKLVMASKEAKGEDQLLSYLRSDASSFDQNTFSEILNGISPSDDPYFSEPEADEAKGEFENPDQDKPSSSESSSEDEEEDEEDTNAEKNEDEKDEEKDEDNPNDEEEKAIQPSSPKSPEVSRARNWQKPVSTPTAPDSPSSRTRKQQKEASTPNAMDTMLKGPAKRDTQKKRKTTTTPIKTGKKRKA